MSDKLSQAQLENILDDIRNEPPWRKAAQREADMYDGNQLDSITLARMEELGIPPIIVNLIKPTVDTVLGLETKTRSDPIVRAELDEHEEGAEGLNQKLKEAIRMTRFNRAFSDAFGEQCKAGMGWVFVGRNEDLFKYRYAVTRIHRSEMWPDWRAREPDFSDARFMVRRKWYDADHLATVLPKHKKLINQAISLSPLWEGDDGIDDSLARSWEIERTTSIQNEEWRDTVRHRLALYEVWYKVFARVHVLNLPGGRVVELNKKDPRHIEAVLSGMVQPIQTSTEKMRCALYLGPHALEDNPTKYAHNRFPYVPLVGFREDRSGAPYGLIRSMVSPQDEVNARRSKMMYNLSTRRVIADEDAVKDHVKTASEVARPDSYIILNELRKNANGFRIESDGDLNQQQYQLMLEAKNNVQEASGLFQEMMGRSAGSGQSGEAIKSLVEQGTQVLGEMFDNTQEGRRLGSELLLSMIVEDMADQNDIPVTVEKSDGTKKRVVLNQRADHETIPGFRNNDVVRLRTKVVLDEMPATASYRQQVLARMMDLTQTLPPELQFAVIDLIVNAMDLPNKADYIERIRKVTGQGIEQAPEDKKAKEQQQALQQKDIDLSFREREVAILEKEQRARESVAKIQSLLANARFTIAKADKLSSTETQLDQAQIEKTLHDIEMDLINHLDQRNQRAQQAQQTSPPDPR